MKVLWPFEKQNPINNTVLNDSNHSLICEIGKKIWLSNFFLLTLFMYGATEEEQRKKSKIRF